MSRIMQPGKPAHVARREFIAVAGLLPAIAATTKASAAQGGDQVPLRVVQAPNGATLALVPVYLHDHGPYTFALDTGASQSLIDEPIVKKLKLKVSGKTEEATAVACSAQLELVEVKRWRIGSVELPAATVTSLKLPEVNGKHGLQGLIGSDVLSRYGSFTLDYTSQLLTLK